MGAARSAQKPNIVAVKGFFAAQHCGELDESFTDHVHPDFRFVVSCACNEDLRVAVPWAGYEHKGREGFNRLTTLVFSEYELLSFDIERYTDAGDQVFVEGHFRLRNRETAKVADSDFLLRFDMRKGKIVRGHLYENTAAVADARRME